MNCFINEINQVKKQAKIDEDIQIEDISRYLVRFLKEHQLLISFAESCTGGMLASTLINASGASQVFLESYVTYAIEAKKRILHVKQSTLDKFSVYSKEVAEEMAQGLYQITKSSICVSVTGLAGGDELNPNDGDFYYSVYLNIGNNHKIITEKKYFSGLRNEIRYQQTYYILWKVYQILLSELTKNNS